MEPPGKPNYRVVKRDGIWVVERADSAVSAPGKPHFRLPSISWRHTGLTLFSSRHEFDLTEDGNAILSADQLTQYIKLDARSYDQYYVTPEQQAVLGWWGLLQFAAFGAIAAVGLLGLFDRLWFLLILLGMAAWAGGVYIYTSRVEPIRGQQYEPQ